MSKRKEEQPGLLTGKVRATWLMDTVVIRLDSQNNKD